MSQQLYPWFIWFLLSWYLQADVSKWLKNFGVREKGISSNLRDMVHITKDLFWSDSVMMDFMKSFVRLILSSQYLSWSIIQTFVCCGKIHFHLSKNTSLTRGEIVKVNYRIYFIVNFISPIITIRFYRSCQIHSSSVIHTLRLTDSTYYCHSSPRSKAKEFQVYFVSFLFGSCHRVCWSLSTRCKPRSQYLPSYDASGMDYGAQCN